MFLCDHVVCFSLLCRACGYRVYCCFFFAVFIRRKVLLKKKAPRRGARDRTDPRTDPNNGTVEQRVSTRIFARGASSANSQSAIAHH